MRFLVPNDFEENVDIVSSKMSLTLRYIESSILAIFRLLWRFARTCALFLFQPRILYHASLKQPLNTKRLKVLDSFSFLVTSVLLFEILAVQLNFFLGWDSRRTLIGHLNSSTSLGGYLQSTIRNISPIILASILFALITAVIGKHLGVDAKFKQFLRNTAYYCWGIVPLFMMMIYLLFLTWDSYFYDDLILLVGLVLISIASIIFLVKFYLGAFSFTSYRLNSKLLGSLCLSIILITCTFYLVVISFTNLRMPLLNLEEALLPIEATTVDSFFMNNSNDVVRLQVLMRNNLSESKLVRMFSYGIRIEEGDRRQNLHLISTCNPDKKISGKDSILLIEPGPQLFEIWVSKISTSIGSVWCNEESDFSYNLEGDHFISCSMVDADGTSRKYNIPIKHQGYSGVDSYRLK